MRTKAPLLLATALLLSGCGRASDTSAHDAEWEAQQQRTRKQLDDYDRQTKRVDENQATAEAQSRRFEALLGKWEEQARRYDAILDAMEKQHGAKK